MEGFRSNYNTLIAKFKKADVWLDNKEIPTAKKMEWLDQGKMNILTIELSRMMKEYERLTGEEMDIKNILEGFDAI